MKKRSKIILAVLLFVMVTIAGACGNTGGDATGSSTNALPPTDTGSIAVDGSGNSTTGGSTAGSSANVGDVANDPVVELTIAHSAAPGSITDIVWSGWATAIERESGGSIKIKMYGAGSLIQTQEYYDALSEGRVDIVDLQTSYFSSYIPEFQVLEVPGIYRVGATEEGFAALKKLKEPIDEIVQQYGFKFPAIYPSDQSSFVGEKLIADPQNDLTGTTVRVSGKWNGRGVEEWGGAPVNIAVGELSTALERKTVSMALTSWPIIDGFKLYESAPYVTLTGIQEVPGGALMNLDSWNKLTDNQKAAMERAAADYEEGGQALVAERKQEFLDKMAAEGVEVLESSAEANDHYSAIAWKIVDEEIAPNASDLGKKLIEACRVPELQGN